MALQPTLRYSVMEYLTMERAACERHEYLDGHVYAMAGESPAHGQICVNLIASLHGQLRGGPCQVFTQNMKVRCESPLRRAHASQGLYAYPDLVVVCGAMQFHDAVQDVLLNPTLLVEVLSSSTEGYDRGDKFRRYRTWLQTLTDYVLVDQAQPAIDHFHRTPEGVWTLQTAIGLEDRLHIATLGWTVALADVYERVVFPETPLEEEDDQTVR